MLYRSHYSHNAPICPFMQDKFPSFHPPKQFKGKFKQYVILEESK